MDTVFLAAAFGIMLFSSAVLAPTVFSRLGADAAKPLLRAFWPRYYAINGALAVLAAVFAAQGYVGLLAVSVAVMMGLSLVATPALNRARDEGRQRAFSLGHRALVAINLLALVTVGWAIRVSLVGWVTD
jgi:hypothetical protein